MNRYRTVAGAIFCTLLSLLLLSSGPDVSAQGNLLVTPRRIVFEGSRRSVDLNLANTGADTATYTISLVQFRMKEDGSFEPVTQPDPGQRFADSHLRFFPRSVTLGPNEAQVIKVQVSKANELTDGEYRSHFYFRAVPRPKPMGEETPVKDTSSISVRLTPIFGITIPVIIRVGPYNANISLSGGNLLIINDSIPRISIDINRSGTMSVYGDLAVDHISHDGKITRVGIANGVAVYTPNSIRRFAFNLNRIKGVDFSSGKLKVTYTATSDIKQSIFADTEIILKR